MRYLAKQTRNQMEIKGRAIVQPVKGVTLLALLIEATACTLKRGSSSPERP
jgi:hypothetical protein